MQHNVTTTGQPVEPDATDHHLIIKFFAHIISVLFHPLFIPAYVTAFLLYLHPYTFAGIAENKKIFTLLPVVFNTVFLPAFSVFIMKQLGFISSITLKTQRDRIIPYITSMIFYFWIWYVSRNTPDMPVQLVAFLLAAFLISIAGLMSNIYLKISMHTMAMGALLVFFTWFALNTSVNINSYLAIVMLATGLVCSARMVVSTHTPFEIYAGLAVGGLCQLAAIFITS